MNSTVQSEQINELAEALSQLQAEVELVPATAVNPFFNSKYAPLPDSIENSKELLGKHGLSLIQLPASYVTPYGVPMVGLSSTLLHKSGQWIRDVAYLPLALTKTDKNGKTKETNVSQEAKIIISSLRKISLFGVVKTAEDAEDFEGVNVNTDTSTGMKKDDVVNRRKDTVNEIFVSNPTKQDAYRKLFDEYGGVDKINDAGKLAELIKKMKGVK